jgi:hypothetical protein
LGIYSTEIAPRIEAYMGKCANIVALDLRSRGNFDATKSDIFFINHDFIALYVKRGTSLATVLPTNYIWFNKLTTFNIDSILYNNII